MVKLGIHRTRPNAVQFMASDIPSASNRAFCDGSTLSPPVAPSAMSAPITVPAPPTIAAEATMAKATLAMKDAVARCFHTR